MRSRFALLLAVGAGLTTGLATLPAATLLAQKPAPAPSQQGGGAQNGRAPQRPAPAAPGGQPGGQPSGQQGGAQGAQQGGNAASPNGRASGTQPSGQAAGAAGNQSQAPLAPMLAHRAAYRLTLDHARDNANVVSARGAMIYEQADACDGWATRQRFQLTLTDRDGQDVETTSDYSTYETKDGRSIRFSLTQTSQGAVSQRIQGEATLNPDGQGGTVRYTSPVPKEMPLPPGTLFPMVHTEHALQAARAGKRLMLAPLFDGTSADGAQDSTTAIVGWLPPQNNARFPLLSPLGSARMRVAFFNRNQSGQDGGTGAPDYEVGLRYWENGVADEMKMDFGDFVVNGEMMELQPIPAGC